MSVASKPSTNYQFCFNTLEEVNQLGLKRITDIESIKTGDWIIYDSPRERGEIIMAHQVVEKTAKRVTITTLNYNAPGYNMGMRETTQLSLLKYTLPASYKERAVLRNKSKHLRFYYHLTDAEFRTIFKIA